MEWVKISDKSVNCWIYVSADDLENTAEAEEKRKTAVWGNDLPKEMVEQIKIKYSLGYELRKMWIYSKNVNDRREFYSYIPGNHEEKFAGFDGFIKSLDPLFHRYLGLEYKHDVIDFIQDISIGFDFGIDIFDFLFWEKRETSENYGIVDLLLDCLDVIDCHKTWCKGKFSVPFVEFFLRSRPYFFPQDINEYLFPEFSPEQNGSESVIENNFAGMTPRKSPRQNHSWEFEKSKYEKLYKKHKRNFKGTNKEFITWFIDEHLIKKSKKTYSEKQIKLLMYTLEGMVVENS